MACGDHQCAQLQPILSVCAAHSALLENMRRQSVKEAPTQFALHAECADRGNSPHHHAQQTPTQSVRIAALPTARVANRWRLCVETIWTSTAGNASAAKESKQSVDARAPTMRSAARAPHAAKERSNPLPAANPPTLFVL